MRNLFACLIFAAAAATPGVALAQSAQCALPTRVEQPELEGPTADEPRRAIPIGSYTLAISWSPQYCASAGSKSPFQCDGRRAKFGFTLHGLWPDGHGAQWPQYCRPAQLVPPAVIRQNLCTTPSAQLIQHEWAKHGTCMTDDPERYFNLSRAFYQSLRYPDMAALARRPSLTVAQFAQAFARANKGMKPNMMRVTTARGHWLSEVWICMDTKLRYTRCPDHQGGAKNSSPLRIAAGPAIPAARKVPPRPADPTRQPGWSVDLGETPRR